jgi:RimJ/RimL family protein N-acetyltransferase
MINAMTESRLPRLRAVTLEGRLVRLEPMSEAHVDGLARVALDAEIWRWMPARLMDRDGVAAWMATAMRNRDAGTELPFVTIDRATGAPIGSSRYLNIALEHGRLEIGWTWLATRWQRTGANREAKLLMIGHAIDDLGCARVEFKTDALNERSRAALVGIGATSEGIFRKHMRMPDGRIRDSAWYSITDDDWPAVRTALAASVAASLAASPAHADAERPADPEGPTGRRKNAV